MKNNSSNNGLLLVLALFAMVMFYQCIGFILAGFMLVIVIGTAIYYLSGEAQYDRERGLIN